VLQFDAISSVTCGIEPMSAYRAEPPLSATIVLTHGMPWYLRRMSSTFCADCALLTSKKWLKTRKLSTFTSRIANAVVGPQGSGMPASSVRTGPKRVV
jgi:hypothetical protein